MHIKKDSLGRTEILGDSHFAGETEGDELGWANRKNTYSIADDIGWGWSKRRQPVTSVISSLPFLAAKKIARGIKGVKWNKQHG